MVRTRRFWKTAVWSAGHYKLCVSICQDFTCHLLVTFHLNWKCPVLRCTARIRGSARIERLCWQFPPFNCCVLTSSAVCRMSTVSYKLLHTIQVICRRNQPSKSSLLVIFLLRLAQHLSNCSRVAVYSHLISLLTESSHAIQVPRVSACSHVCWIDWRTTTRNLWLVSCVIRLVACYLSRCANTVVSQHWILLCIVVLSFPPQSYEFRRVCSPHQ